MAHLLIIDLPGGNDTDIVLAARNAGHSFSFLSSQLDLYRRQPSVQATLNHALEHIEVPSFEYDEVERRVLALDHRHPIDAVLCLIDIRLTEAARLAHRLGLPYLNPTSAALMRDKYEVRRRLTEAGLPQPEFELAASNAQLKQAVQRIGLPVLIKPVDGYGSQNIVVLRNAEDLQPWISPLEGMLPSRADYGLGVMANDRLLVERYMQAYRETIDYMYGDNPQVLKDYAAFAGVSEAMAKRVRDEFFPRALLMPDEIKGLDSLMADAVELKFISAPLSKEKIADLVQLQRPRP